MFLSFTLERILVVQTFIKSWPRKKQMFLLFCVTCRNFACIYEGHQMEAIAKYEKRDRQTEKQANYRRTYKQTWRRAERKLERKSAI